MTFAETYRNMCIEINITKAINPNPNGESWSGGENQLFMGLNSSFACLWKISSESYSCLVKALRYNLRKKIVIQINSVIHVENQFWSVFNSKCW